MKNKHSLLSQGIIARTILAFNLAILCFNVQGQIMEGESQNFFTCKGRTETYGYLGGNTNSDNFCVVQWTVVGGVFPDAQNGTVFDTGTDPGSGVSSATVKWTSDSPNGTISVISNCANGNSSKQVDFQRNPTTLTATPSSVNAGTELTLTASPTFDFNSIVWSSTPDGNLIKTTGTPVTAKPMNISTYTATVTSNATLTLNQTPIKTITCLTVASIDVNVIFPPLTNNVITTSGTKFFNNNTGSTKSFDPTLIVGSYVLGGTSTIGFQWQYSTTSSTSGFVNLFTSSSNYDPLPITQTTYFRRIAQSATAKTSYSNVITYTVINSNTINFLGLSISGSKYYYARPSTPSKLTGVAPTGTSLTAFYQWLASSDGKTYHVIYGNDPLQNTPGETYETTYYAREVSYRDTNGNIIYSAMSNAVIAYIFDAISNNTICCDQLVAGLNLPALVTGTVPTGGGTALTNMWQISKDNINWANASTSTKYQADKGLVGKLYVRRIVKDATPTPTSGISNVIILTYANTIPKGRTLSNPIEILGTLTQDCFEDIELVNSLDGRFINNYGGPDNDCYFKLTTNGAMFGAYSCGSAAPTKLYLLNSSGQLRTPRDVRSNCEFYDYATPFGPSYYYIVVEGNGTLRLHIGSYVYSDCSDGYSQRASAIPHAMLSAAATEERSISIHPNPASSIATLILSDESDKSTKKIQVIDKTNRIIKTEDTSESTLELKVSDLKPDIYMVRIITNGSTKTLRLSVK